MPCTSGPAVKFAGASFLWLQGAPGCSSLFGSLYELGPELVTEELGLMSNPSAWNRHAGLLLLDQPVGSGLSVLGADGHRPSEEMELAADAYVALQGFFQQYRHLRKRPLVIAGESYAGKFPASATLSSSKKPRLWRTRRRAARVARPQRSGAPARCASAPAGLPCCAHAGSLVSAARPGHRQRPHPPGAAGYDHCGHRLWLRKAVLLRDDEL